jgi:hypothetical protein
MPETKSKAGGEREGGRGMGMGGGGDGRGRVDGGKKGCSILNTFQNINISYLFYSSCIYLNNSDVFLSSL